VDEYHKNQEQENLKRITDIENFDQDLIKEN